MSGGPGEQRWSSRQRLVVLTFDDDIAAQRWDDTPNDVAPLLTIPILWDAPTLRLMEACRDVIDEWHEWASDVDYVSTLDGIDLLGAYIDRMRATLFELRQSRMDMEVGQ